jgi:hypothetical protein
MRKGQYPPGFNVQKAYDNAQMRKRIQQNALLQRIPQGTFVPGRMAQRVQTYENRVHAMRNPTFHKGTTQAPLGPRVSSSPGRPYGQGHVQSRVPSHVTRPSVHVPITLPDIQQTPTTNPLMNGFTGVLNPNGSRSSSGRRSRSRSSGRRGTSRSPGRRGTSRSPSKNKTNKKNGSNKRGVTRINSKGRRQTWL